MSTSQPSSTSQAITNSPHSSRPRVSSTIPTRSSPFPSQAGTPARHAVSPSPTGGLLQRPPTATPTRRECSSSASAEQSPRATPSPAGHTATSRTAFSPSPATALLGRGTGRSRLSRVRAVRRRWALRWCRRATTMMCRGRWRQGWRLWCCR